MGQQQTIHGARDYQIVSLSGPVSGKAANIPAWPQGKHFAFTIFDDPDAQNLAQSKLVYSFLRDLGFLTTKGVWMIEPEIRNSGGETCEQPDYLDHVLSLVDQGFEPGYHSGAPGDLRRSEVLRSLDLFQVAFQNDPLTMANHYNSDAMYWGNARVSGLRRFAYRAANKGGNSQFHGDSVGHSSFWGDLCRERITYCRNFVTRNLNTLSDFPFVPYFDPIKPFVRGWYGSSEGANYRSFTERLAERNQDRLEQEGGACIMYTHFGHGFVTSSGRLEPNFVKLMTRLSHKNGWFVPVGALLNHLRDKQGVHRLTGSERARMEWRWLSSKLRHGTS